MASSSMKSIRQCKIRSISLPCRSHPSTLKIEEELNKLKTWEASSIPTAETISNGLCGLVEVYKCMDELLHMPQTLQALSKHKNEKWVSDLSEDSVKLLDICGITRDSISQVKEHVRDLQSSLRRRRKGDYLSIEACINKYICFRNKMKKDAKRMISSLNQMDHVLEGSNIILDVDQHFSALIRVLREVNAISISIFQLVASYFSASKLKQSRWTISRLVQKGNVTCDDQQDNLNELESVDNALRSLCKPEKINIAMNRLKNLENTLESIELKMEGMFRCLIRSRASFLNIVSC